MMRVLVIEDNQADARLIEILIGEAAPDWELCLSTTLGEALRHAPFEAFDCLLADLNLPDHRGLGIVRQLRDRAPAKAIVVLTALDDDRLALEAIRAGAQDYVTKSDAGLAMLTRIIGHAVERQSTQRALDFSRLTNQALLDGSPDDIVLIDRAGRILALNAPAAGTMHRSIEGAIGQDWLATNPALAEGRHARLASVLASGSTQHFEETDGVRWFLHILRPVQGAQPDDMVVASFVRDISQERAAADTLSELRQDALAANRAKTEFMARMSRELRTPLNDVVGFSEIMATGMLGPLSPPTYGEYLNGIQRAGRQIMNILDGISDLSILESAFIRDEGSYRDLVELSPDFICVSLDGLIERINGAGAELLRGLAPSSFQGRKITEFLHPDYHPVADDDFRVLVDERRPVPIKMITAGGKVRNVEMSAVRLQREGGRPAALLVGRDITEISVAMAHVAAREHRIRAILDTVADGVVTVNESGGIETVNVAFCGIFGFAAGELTGLNLGALLPDLAIGGSTNGHLLAELCGEPRELVGRRRDESLLTLHVGVSELLFDEQRLFTCTVRDLTEQRMLTDRIAYLANHDPLTDLPNRSFLARRIEEEVAQARVESGMVAVATIDLRGFTTINDSLGHDVGNAVLRETALRLRASIPENGTVARLSADEFAVVLPDHAGLDAIQASVGVLCEALARPYQVGGSELQVTNDVGVSIYPRDALTAGDLFRNAETALHATKRSESRVGFFDSTMTTKVSERLALERSIRRALDLGQFELFYQPQMAMLTGKIVGAEALIRWRHPDLGLVGPDKFIPVAEHNGLIVPIGEWVLRQVCTQMQFWRGTPLAQLRIGVNISGRQFRESSLIRTIESVLKDAEAEASRLDLELTESMLMSEAEETLRLLNDLKALGVHISIDDFGTGYSSLAYLKRFPVDTIKIDRAFVKDLDTDEEDRVIANAIISLAHSLGLSTVAEGVETASQAELLAAHGCDEIQGYLIGRPMPAAQFTELVLGHEGQSKDGPSQPSRQAPENGLFDRVLERFARGTRRNR